MSSHSQLPWLLGTFYLFVFLNRVGEAGLEGGFWCGCPAASSAACPANRHACSPLCTWVMPMPVPIPPRRTHL